MDKETKIFHDVEIKESDTNDLTVVHFISSEKRDRGGDILYADGMKMEGRPVVLFQHGFNESIGSEPIAKPLWIKKDEFKGRKGIKAKTQFYPDELGKRLWRKAVDGFLPNWSIGWRPIKAEFKNERDGSQTRHVYEWELLEYSLVSVPMQPDAQNVDKTAVICFKMASSGTSDEKRFIINGISATEGTVRATIEGILSKIIYGELRKALRQ